ncbi:hypothetical protein [Janthinobacterium lividum]|uniref:hypothetical protein n=1 Tax=Janthinobacterium lividum TaxID=29581 RepID=UPI001113060B|nr:hypothetical protein [Janthinobacterium lividum]MCC7714476.1 hypothetical protein [Janthinobacterium lividum]WQE30322.1 hypothetical protein U0004_07840 [Janthinobacterium lividum]
MALLLGDLDNLAFAEDNSLAMPVILLAIFFAAAIDVRVGLVGVTDNNGRGRESRFLVLVNMAYLLIALALCWCSGMAGFNSGGEPPRCSALGVLKVLLAKCRQLTGQERMWNKLALLLAFRYGPEYKLFNSGRAVAYF